MIKSFPKALCATIGLGALALVAVPANAQGCRDGYRTVYRDYGYDGPRCREHTYQTSYSDDDYYGRNSRRVVYHTSYRNCGYHRPRRVIYVSDPYDYGYRRSCHRRSGLYVSYRSGRGRCSRHSSGLHVSLSFGGGWR